MAQGLPDFKRPPVVEVAIGVQFDPVGLAVPHLGLLWQEYREELPRFEEKPPLDPVVERFGVRTPLGQPKITLMEHPPANRLWFHNESGDELVQVQPDRFIFNWRQVDPNREYPRYEAVEASFFRAFSKFSTFLAAHGLSSPRITQCEVTYVNHILPAEGVWSSHGAAGNAVTLVGSPGGDFLPAPEDVRAAARFIINTEAHEQAGRLHITLEPRFFVQGDQPLLFLQLVTRGAPLGEGLEGARTFFRLGREWIVRGFFAVTTSAMHKEWGLV